MSRCIEQLADELDLALNAWLFVMDMAALDCSDRLYPAESGFGGSQGPKALTVSK